MIISHKYKFVFIHIYKNAGTFVTNLIKKLDPDAIDVRDIHGIGHQKYVDICKMDIFDKIKHYTFFVVIRNPVDQIISTYNFIIKKNYIESTCTFDEFITSSKNYVDVFVSKNTSWIIDDNNNICNNIKLIDFENLQAGLTPLFLSLGIPKRTLLKASILYQTPLNVSNKYYKKNNKLMNADWFLKLLNNSAFCKELLFYNTCVKEKKQFNFNT
jgi:hypothetical protein